MLNKRTLRKLEPPICKKAEEYFSNVEKLDFVLQFSTHIVDHQRLLFIDIFGKQGDLLRVFVHRTSAKKDEYEYTTFNYSTKKWLSASIQNLRKRDECGNRDYLLYSKEKAFINSQVAIDYFRFSANSTDCLLFNINNCMLRAETNRLEAKRIKLADYMKGQNILVTVPTVIKYLGYLKEAYIIEDVHLYSPKAKAKLNYYYKLYDEDVSLNSIRQSGPRYDLTHNLENVVLNELIFRGYEVSVYNNKGREIDFLAVKDNKQYLVQVAYSIAEDKTYEREFSAFAELDNSMKKIIITNDDIDYSTSTVYHYRLKDFLKMDEL